MLELYLGPCVMLGPVLTSTPETKDTSRSVGNTLNTRAERMKLIPLDREGSNINDYLKDTLIALLSPRDPLTLVPCAPVHCSGHGPCLP